MKKAITFAVLGIFGMIGCGCCHIDYKRGEVPIPICQHPSATQTNVPSFEEHDFDRYVYPGSARNLTKRENWFLDEYGRYVLFRGVNIGSQGKQGPLYLPIKIDSFTNFDAELQRVSPCLDALQSLGFNAVRLVVTWKGMESLPGAGPSTNYLNALDKFLEALYQRNLYGIVDFHQDIASDLYGGDGFPDWALTVDKNHPIPGLPPDPSPHWFARYVDLSYPVSVFLDPHWPWRVPLSNLVRNTQHSFWKDSTDNVFWHLKSYQSKSDFVQMLGQAANHWKTNPAVIGYEPFNEPNTVGFNRVEFEAKYLTAFYTSVLREIREVAKDTNSFVFIEPRVDWDIHPTNTSESGFSFISAPAQIQTFLGTNFDAGSDLSAKHRDERGVFSFHFYDPWSVFYGALPLGGLSDCMKNKQTDWPPMYKTMIAAATGRDLIPFMTEFGVQNVWRKYKTSLQKGVYDTQDRAYLDLSFKQMETSFLNATLWNYDFYATDPENGGDNWNEESLSVLSQTNEGSWKIRNADILARPYPVRSSAKPELLYFDIKSKHAAIVLSGKTVAAPTVIYVPRDIQYTNQFDVFATSPLFRWDDQRELLFWKPDPTLATNQIIICPAGAFDRCSIPKLSKELLPITTNHWTALRANR